MVRAPEANPATAGAPSVPVSTCTWTGSSPVSLATSARAGAGIRIGGGSQAPDGCQGSSRSAARYRSVATMVIASAVKVTWMVHRSGQRVVPGRGDHDLADGGGELGGAGLPGRGS